MEFLSADWFSALLAIILIDLVLAGDNAIVIALAAPQPAATAAAEGDRLGHGRRHRRALGDDARGRSGCCRSPA
jgi:hypothetical protein